MHYCWDGYRWGSFQRRVKFRLTCGGHESARYTHPTVDKDYESGIKDPVVSTYQQDTSFVGSWEFSLW